MPQEHVSETGGEKDRSEKIAVCRVKLKCLDLDFESLSFHFSFES
jgi:hypothetical protein